MTVKEVEAKVTGLETRLDEMAGRVDELEAIVKALHLDAAADAARKPARTRKRKRQGGRKWTEDQKRAFRVRMVEGQLKSAKEDGRSGDVEVLEGKLQIARDRLDEFRTKEAPGAKASEETPDEGDPEG
jgi:TolA-binding protein